MIMNKQEGAALLVSLMLLLVLTLLAVSAVNLSTVNLRIVNNMQTKKATETLVQDAIETVIDQEENFGELAAVALTIGTEEDKQVVISPRVCLFDFRYGQGSEDHVTSQRAMAPMVNVWEIKGEHTNTLTGAKTTIVQGHRLLQSAGYCI